MKYTLKQLQVFAETARFGNISRAASFLNLSQSAASNALKEFENQYDTRLFDRIGKRLKLNETGTSIRPLVEELLAQAQTLESQLSMQSALGELKVGATLTIGNYLTANLMVQFLTDHANAKLDLQVANTATIAQRVLNYQLDMGLIEGEVNHPDLHTQAWRDDRLVIFAAADHPLANKADISSKDLRRTPWILREQGSGTRQVFERGMAELFPQLNILLELDQTQAIKQAVKSGLGIGCLSEITLSESFQNGSLVPLHFPEADFSRRFYVLRHKQKYLSNAMKLWLECVHANSAA